MDVVVNGHSVFVATGGVAFDPALPVLVLVHGAGMDHSAWAQQSRALAHGGFAVLAPDLPGHGRSDGPALTRVEDVADWLDALLATLAVERATVAGHSLGGLVVLDFAARYPDRTARAVILGGAAAMPVHEELLNAARDALPKAIAMIVGWGFAQPLAPSPVPGLSLTASAKVLLARSQPGVLHADLAACARYVGGEVAAEVVGVPVTLIHGRADRMVPFKAAKALAARLRNPRVVEIAGAGHMVQLENPQAALAALLAG